PGRHGVTQIPDSWSNLSRMIAAASAPPGVQWRPPRGEAWRRPIVHHVTRGKHAMTTFGNKWELDGDTYKTLLESTRAIPWKIDWDSMRFAYIGPQIEEL